MPHLTLPIAKINIQDIRPKTTPRVMVGRVSFEIPTQRGVTGLTLNDYQTRTMAQLKTCVDGFSDQSILATGLPEIQLRFCWPGYERFVIVERVPLAGLKCNGEVAARVATAFSVLMQKASRLPCKSPECAIVPGSPYTAKSIVLLALLQIHGDVFVAEVDYAPTTRMT
ncbi:hypothetical protein GY45DRAFT_1367434 [Cubamyces sp. BRFM 1775]|nr:hypothetical protein GY45DRAFT_1367434 [Cubamyces sp. BRFM 1775]